MGGDSGFLGKPGEVLSGRHLSTHSARSARRGIAILKSWHRIGPTLPDECLRAIQDISSNAIINSVTARVPMYGFAN